MVHNTAIQPGEWLRKTRLATRYPRLPNNRVALRPSESLNEPPTSEAISPATWLAVAMLAITMAE